MDPPVVPVPDRCPRRHCGNIGLGRPRMVEQEPVAVESLPHAVSVAIAVRIPERAANGIILTGL